MSELRVWNKLIYSEGQIAQNGPLDLRMGIGHKSQKCETCSISQYDCPGHFGHIDLNVPIYHLGFFRHVIMSLNCVCRRCGFVKLQDKDYYRKRMLKCMLKQNYRKRMSIFKEIVLKCKKMTVCSNCGFEMGGKLKKLEKVSGKIIYDDGHSRQEINAIQAFNIFQQVAKEDHILFAIDPNKNQLSDLITSVLAVPPNIIRPSVLLSNQMSNEDDLTVKVKTFLSYNEMILKNIEEGHEISKFIQSAYMLQSHYFHYFNSNTPNLPFSDMRCKQDIRCLYSRLKGKRGRFRGNLMGKRVNYAARTVISPDPNLEIDQVRVPQFMAKILTIPERVNKLNMKKLQKLVVNGKYNYPGANYVIIDGGKKDLQFGDRRLISRQLQIGSIVERHLQKDDIVLFNRQPSLHRISIMCLRVIVDQWNTLRFNECACTPFNADFDGDEMNLHAPQTLEAQAEALELMNIKNNLLTSKNGECIVSLLQDFLTTSWLITNKDTFFTRQQFCQLCAGFSDGNEHIQLPPPTILKPKELWTGKQVINSLLRPNRQCKILVNLEIKESNSLMGDCMDPKDGYVIFYKSELVCGNIGKKVLGASKQGLFYTLNRDNGCEAAVKVMLRFSKLSSRYISHYGMTIGIGDVTPTQELIQLNNQKIKESYESCQEDIKLYDQNKLATKPGMSIEQTLESLIKKKLSDVRDVIGTNCQQQLKSDNKVLTMFQCGAKGSNINMSQMIGCVGQQVVSGKRVPDGFTKRSLPHFVINDRHPKAKGFVKNSFYTGMNAVEFFFHTMGGREGLIDTAVKTADTGYMQRRLIKMLEDLHIAYDMTVRSCDTKEIIQFNFGEDGMDPCLVEDIEQPIRLNIIYLNANTIIKKGQNLEYNDKMNLLNQLIDKKQEQYKGIINNCLNAFQKEKQRLLNFWENMNGSTELIEWYIEEWIRRLFKLFLPPGSSVGPIASQSIGEPATQMTLKTFHFAGVASMNVTLGVPRIKEIINAAKTIKTPILKIKIDEDKKFSDMEARKILIQIEKTMLGQIIKSMSEIYQIGGCYLLLELDKKAISQLQLDISEDDIINGLLKHKKLNVKREQIEMRQGQIKINFGLNLKNKKLKKSVLFELQEVKNQIMDVQIKGLGQIKQVVISKVEKNNEEEDELKDERILFAEGYGLKEILNMEGVKGSKTKSNHIMEIQKILGIEAARQRIIEEIVYTMKSHGISLDIRHILLAAETMTFKGEVLGFTRHGVTKLKNSTLMLASFEKTMDILFDAAIQGKEDSINGVSQRIIFGQNVPIGTGMFDLMQGKPQLVKDSQWNQQFLFS